MQSDPIGEATTYALRRVRGPGRRDYIDLRLLVFKAWCDGYRAAQRSARPKTKKKGGGKG